MPDEVEASVGEVEQDRVADDEAVGVHSDVLLGLPRREVREAVDGQPLEQRQRVGSVQEEIGHVVRLIEQRARLAPGRLLAAPVAELRPDRERVRPRGRVSEELDRAANARDRGFQALFAHLSPRF